MVIAIGDAFSNRLWAATLGADNVLELPASETGGGHSSQSLRDVRKARHRTLGRTVPPDAIAHQFEWPKKRLILAQNPETPPSYLSRTEGAGDRRLTTSPNDVTRCMRLASVSSRTA